MVREREMPQAETALLSISNTRVITPEYIDNYGNHLNEALALLIFEQERLKILSKEKMEQHGVLGVVRKQEVKYFLQVFEGDTVKVNTFMIARRAKLHFLHQMIRGEDLAIDDLVEVVMINNRGKATRIPAFLIQELQNKL